MTGFSRTANDGRSPRGYFGIRKPSKSPDKNSGNFTGIRETQFRGVVRFRTNEIGRHSVWHHYAYFVTKSNERQKYAIFIPISRQPHIVVMVRVVFREYTNIVPCMYVLWQIFGLKPPNVTTISVPSPGLVPEHLRSQSSRCRHRCSSSLIRQHPVVRWRRRRRRRLFVARRPTASEAGVGATPANGCWASGWNTMATVDKRMNKNTINTLAKKKKA